jgi:hypothetical protein
MNNRRTMTEFIRPLFVTSRPILALTTPASIRACPVPA